VAKANITEMGSRYTFPEEVEGRAAPPTVEAGVEVVTDGHQAVAVEVPVVEEAARRQAERHNLGDPAFDRGGDSRQVQS
jgi:hypothetical protein